MNANYSSSAFWFAHLPPMCCAIQQTEKTRFKFPRMWLSRWTKSHTCVCIKNMNSFSRSFSATTAREPVDYFVLLNKRHNILILDVLSWLKRWKRGSMMKHADPLLNALVLGRQRWRALIGLEKILVVIVTANRVHALSWDVMNSAVPLPCGGYLLRNVFLEVGLYTLCNDV